MTKVLTIEQNEMLDAVRTNGGKISVLRRIANRDNIHFQIGESDASLLHVAALDGHYSCVEGLLGMGIKATVTDATGQTPLHYCVTATSFSPDRAKIVKLLVASGASLEDKSKFGNTPLHQACGLGCSGMVNFLLKQGANASATNNDGDSPLHLAAKHNQAGNACKLLDNGADVFALNTRGRTPVDVVGTQNVENVILTHKLSIASRENTQFRQEVHDLKNLILATAVLGSRLTHKLAFVRRENARLSVHDLMNLIMAIAFTVSIVRRRQRRRRYHDPIQQQQQQQQVKFNINSDSNNRHERTPQQQQYQHGNGDTEKTGNGSGGGLVHHVGCSDSAPVYLMAAPPSPPPTTPTSSSTIIASPHPPHEYFNEKSESMHPSGGDEVGMGGLTTKSTTGGVKISDDATDAAVSMTAAASYTQWN